MYTKTFALYGGVLMIILGIVSFIPGLEGSTATLPALKVTTSYGLFLGFFPLNIYNKLALIAFGIAGILSYRTTLTTTVTYAKMVFFVMGILAILGIFPQTSTLGGIWPLFNGEVFAHGLFALTAGACVLAETKRQLPTSHYGVRP